MTENDSKLVRDAAMFARGAHAGRKYGKELPYAYHLGTTALRLDHFLSAEHFGKERLLAAAWLHDTLEDTGAKYEDLYCLFGEYIANVVDAVTDRPGVNRHARHVATYPMIRLIGGDGAVLVKLADRIANVEYSLQEKDKGKVRMYREEWREFQRLVGRPDPDLGSTNIVETKMWERLDTLMKEKP